MKALQKISTLLSCLSFGLAIASVIGLLTYPFVGTASFLIPCVCLFLVSLLLTATTQAAINIKKELL